MTVSSVSNDTRYSGNGVTLVFAAGFTFYAASTLRVSQIAVATGVETVKVLTTDYSVSGGAGASGSVTMLVAPPSGTTLVIKRVEPYSQLTDLQDNDGLPAATLELTYDKLEMQIQQVKTIADSAIKPPPVFNPNTTAAYTMPVPVSGAALVGNAAGTGWEGSLIAVTNPATLPVITTSLANHDILEYDSAATTWRNKVGFSTIGDLLTNIAGAIARIAIGTTGQVLRVVGGVPAWSNDGLIAIQTFTADGTYTPTTGMRYCIVEAVGGGGGGGGTNGGGAATSGNAGGGGAGGLSISRLTSAQIGASKAVDIGAAGTGGAAGNNNGTAGADTTLGATLIIAKGGSFGFGLLTANTNAGGGLGGVTGTGDITGTGQPGGQGLGTSGQFGKAGDGGSTKYGGGGRGNGSATGVAGEAGSGKGSGGAGGSSYNSAGTFAGGNGAPGYMIIYEYA